MNIREQFLEIGEYGAAGMYEEMERSLFYRKALGIRRYYEKCPLCEYAGKPLYPSGPLPIDACIRPWFFYGMRIDYKNKFGLTEPLRLQYVSDFHRYASEIPPEHKVGADMFSHSLPHYERILKEGLLSYIPRIKKMQDREMREGLLHVMEGIKTYITRSIAYLEEVDADLNLIAALKKVPLYPAETIYEALVSWNFVLYLDGNDNIGRLPAGLAPYFKGENIVPILQNLYDNLSVDEGYSMVLDDRYPELSVQCLEASRGKCYPLIEMPVDENTPECMWEKALSIVRSGNGQPAFYNKKLLFRLLQEKCGIPDADIERFCGVGCTEPTVAGFTHAGSTDAGINLLLVFEKVMHAKLEACDTFEAFYGFVMEAFAETIKTVTDAICSSQLKRAKYMPLPMRTLLTEDCIEKEKDFNAGGARYNWSIISFAGIINVIDALLVIEDFVFMQKTYTAKELLTALRQNDDSFLQKAKTHTRAFGRDDTEVNAFAHRVTKDIFSMLDDKKPAFGEVFLPASIQYNAQASGGKDIGATPCGRSAGAPLCDSIAAIFGKDTNGPTALLGSVTALNLSRAVGVPVLNFNIRPDFDDKTLRSLIWGYMQKGGIQMQITCVSTETLKAAYKNPDKYRNLIVRVGGYSDYYYRLSREMQKMILDRSVQLV